MQLAIRLNKMQDNIVWNQSHAPTVVYLNTFNIVFHLALTERIK